MIVLTIVGRPLHAPTLERPKALEAGAPEEAVEDRPCVRTSPRAHNRHSFDDREKIVRRPRTASRFSSLHGSVFDIAAMSRNALACRNFLCHPRTQGARRRSHTSWRTSRTAPRIQAWQG